MKINVGWADLFFHHVNWHVRFIIVASEKIIIFDFIVLYSQNPWIFDRVELINDEIGLAMIMIEPKRNQNWSKSKIGGR